MSFAATVLYEDSKIGREFPLHQLVLRMVEDDINGETWQLQKKIAENPRNGVDKVLSDVRGTSVRAGKGTLFILVDRDKIIDHYNKNMRDAAKPLPPSATDTQIETAIKSLSDDASKLQVFFLYPNMEGLIASIELCAPGQWTAEIEGAKQKKRTSRDDVLREISKAAMNSIRTCIRQKQPGLDALAKALCLV
jgi:hypothetical protein